MSSISNKNPLLGENRGGFVVSTFDKQGKKVGFHHVIPDVANLIGAFMVSSKQDYDTFRDITYQGPSSEDDYRTFLLDTVVHPAQRKELKELSPKIISPEEMKEREDAFYEYQEKAFLELVSDDSKIDDPTDLKLAIFKTAMERPITNDQILRESRYAIKRSKEIAEHLSSDNQGQIDEYYLPILRRSLMDPIDLGMILHCIDLISIDALDSNAIIGTILRTARDLDNRELAFKITRRTKQALEEGRLSATQIQHIWSSILFGPNNLNCLEGIFDGMKDDKTLIKEFFGENPTRFLSLIMKDANPRFKQKIRWFLLRNQCSLRSLMGRVHRVLPSKRDFIPVIFIATIQGIGAWSLLSGIYSRWRS